MKNRRTVAFRNGAAEYVCAYACPSAINESCILAVLYKIGTKKTNYDTCKIKVRKNSSFSKFGFEMISDKSENI